MDFITWLGYSMWRKMKSNGGVCEKEDEDKW